MYKGVAVSPGVVVGVAYKVESAFGASEPQALANPAMIPAEIGRFDRAVALSAQELEGIVLKVAQQLGDGEAGIFKGHLTIVKDVTLLNKVRALIESQQLTALSALQTVLQDYASRFASIEHEYFRERMTDIRDVISKIGSHLSPPLPRTHSGPDHNGDEPIVLVAHEIMPSQSMSLGELPIAGIVTETGGGTSHAAILSRSRGIPAVSGVVGITSEVSTGDMIVVDGRDGLVIVRPDARHDGRLSQSPARVRPPEGPIGPEPRPARRLGRRRPDRAPGQHQRPRRLERGRRRRRLGRRPVPDRVPVPDALGRPPTRRSSTSTIAR